MTLNQPLNSQSSRSVAAHASAAPTSKPRVTPGSGKDGRSPHRTPPSKTPPSKTPLQTRPGDRPGWAKQVLISWQLWIFLAMGGVTATGSLAFMSLVRLPQALECPRVFWPLASASLRVYCAQAAAEKKTHRGLLDAITLVDSLPEDHPLRPMVDRNIRRWSLELMDVAEELFQDGNLNEALAAAASIPYKHLECTTTECPEEFMKRRTQRWQEIWEEGEKIFDDSEKALIDQKWNKAAEIAVLLLSVENRYWRTTKYEEISAQVQEVRGTNSVLAKARALAEKNDVESLIEAVRLAASISPQSRLYPVAKGALARFGGQLMTLAETSLEGKDLGGTLQILDSIPSQANLEREVRDFRAIARAQSRTWSGVVADIQGAIAELRKLGTDRPYYAKAQELIGRWQTDIVDIARLQSAEKLAANGSTPSLMTAIAEASLIPKTNPRWDDAQALIAAWTTTIQTREDQPVLDRAEQLAQNGTIDGYRAAIDEAKRIGRGRYLYEDARGRIASWQEKLEWLEDQPFLAQARTLAARGNLVGAIASAQRIGSGRLLSGEAQAAIRDWQSQVDAENSLISARGYAQDGWNPDALLQAIETADRVPTSSNLRYDANLEIAAWSNRLLQIAIDRANGDLYRAIEIARMVPPGSDAYGVARDRIAGWEALLQRPEPVLERPSVLPGVPGPALGEGALPFNEPEPPTQPPTSAVESPFR